VHAQGGGRRPEDSARWRPAAGACGGGWRPADVAGGGSDCRRGRSEGQRPAREKAGDGGRCGGRHGCGLSGKPTFFFICISSHLRPCGDGVATHPESGRRPLSSPTRELGRRSGVTDRGIDPEFCDYGGDLISSWFVEKNLIFCISSRLLTTPFVLNYRCCLTFLISNLITRLIKNIVQNITLFIVACFINTSSSKMT